MVRTCDTCGMPIEYRDMYCPKCNPDGLTLFEGVSKDRYDRLREALVDILAHCDEANVVYAHQPNCTCDRCIIGRIARKALEEGSDG